MRNFLIVGVVALLAAGGGGSGGSGGAADTTAGNPIDTNVVPVPAALWLLGLSLLVLTGIRRA